jgi:hypothetical protein
MLSSCEEGIVRSANKERARSACAMPNCSEDHRIDSRNRDTISSTAVGGLSFVDSAK